MYHVYYGGKVCLKKNPSLSWQRRITVSCPPKILAEENSWQTRSWSWWWLETGGLCRSLSRSNLLSKWRRKLREKEFLYFLSLTWVCLFLPALEAPVPLVSARLASRACGVSHSFGRHLCKKGTQVDMYASLFTQAGTSLNMYFSLQSNKHGQKT